MGREWKNETVGVIIICTILGCPKRRESQLILSVHIPASIKKKKKKSARMGSIRSVVSVFKRMVRRHCSIQCWGHLGSGGGVPNHPPRLERPQSLDEPLEP